LKRGWFLKGSYPEIKSPVERHKMSVFGAMGQSGLLILSQSEILISGTFKNFIMLLVFYACVGVNSNGKMKKILLVLDNARYHHALLLKHWLESMSDVLKLFFYRHITLT
jgi:hypothetical protein